jgi:hypothetical protein
VARPVCLKILGCVGRSWITVGQEPFKQGFPVPAVCCFFQMCLESCYNPPLYRMFCAIINSKLHTANIAMRCPWSASCCHLPYHRQQTVFQASYEILVANNTYSITFMAPSPTLFNNVENRKTYRKILFHIKYVFRLSLQLCSETCLAGINIWQVRRV